MSVRYRIERLARHDRSDFSCGEPALDRYFRFQVGQDARSLSSKVFVALEADQVAGFYTMSAAQLQLSELPPEFAKRIPRYPLTPVVLIGRLAVDIRHQGRGLATALLADAARRVSASDVGAVGLVVDPKNAEAKALYSKLGWRVLAGSEGRLFLALQTVHKAGGSPLPSAPI